MTQGVDCRPGSLAKSLGTGSLIFYGIGMILGAGIYSVIGAAAGSSGEALWVSFLLSATVAALTALSYSELSTLYPEAGAAYVYLRAAFPRAKWLAFATAMLVAVSAIGTVPTVALAFSGYLSSFVDLPTPVVTIGFVAVLTLLAVLGIEESSWANILFTLIEAGGLVLFIAIAVSGPGLAGPLQAGARLDQGVLTGAALLFFAYLGFENIANLAEEAREPARSLPFAIIGSVIVTTTLYVLVALAAVSLLPPADLARSAAPLADAAATAGAGWAPRVLSGIALFATANTALIGLIVAARVLFSVARQRELPSILARTLPRRCTPWVATLLSAAVALLLLPLGKIEVVGSLSSLASLLAFAAVNATVIALRRSQPGLPRTFRVPLSVAGVPLPSALGLLTTLAMVSQIEREAHLVGLFALAVIGALYWGGKVAAARAG